MMFLVTFVSAFGEQHAGGRDVLPANDWAKQNRIAVSSS